jgi:hypothetical protein
VIHLHQIYGLFFCFSLSPSPSPVEWWLMQLICDELSKFVTLMYSSNLYCNVTIVIENNRIYIYIYIYIYIFYVLRAICTSAITWNRTCFDDSDIPYKRWLHLQSAVTRVSNRPFSGSD